VTASVITISALICQTSSHWRIEVLRTE